MWKRLLAGATLSAVSFGGVLVGTASPAAAYPNLCHIPNYDAFWGRGGGAHTRCDAGTGYYRVKITCSSSPSSTLYNFFWGNWQFVGSGRYSERFCPTNQYFRGASNDLTE
jgi:hypothetical protein